MDIPIDRLYRGLTTDTLREMRTAFELDRAASDTEDGRAFCDHRLRLIVKILAERGELKT